MRQPTVKPNNPYQRIAELEAKLNRADRYIRRLRKDNNELRRELTWLENRYRQQSTVVEPEVVIVTEPKKPPRRRRRKRPDSYAQPERIDEGRRVPRRRRTKAKGLQLRLLAIASAIAIAFTASVLTITAMFRLLTRPPATAQPSPQAEATSTPQLPVSPLVAPEYPSAQAATLPTLSSDASAENPEPVYNITTAPNLKQSENLQAIVDELVNMAAEKGRPTDALSITLIDVKSNEVAGYQQQELRFPASVLKLFWMVYVYGGLAQGIFPEETAFRTDLYQMIQQSSNNAASRIIDAVTGTKSGEKLKGEAYEEWKRRRLFLSDFFQKAGYDGIILSQKTFSTKDRPTGREGQMWDDPQQPIRNKISSAHAARLMYEIVTGAAISPEYSQKMLQWLVRDLSPEAKADTTRFGGFNPIAGFFGESMPAEIDFASKAGWSSSGRHEVAFVKTRDGKTAYILSILASDRTYSNDWSLFPEMSSFVFKRLNGEG
jgi:Beta-lactamase enzyme family